MKDYYKILGVDRNASPDEIKRAYRRLASQHHPDKGGDTGRFQEIEEAYRVLSDPTGKHQYDNFGSSSGRGFEGGMPFDFDNIFQMFGARFPHNNFQRKFHSRINIWISLQDVVMGGTRTIALSTQAGSHALEIQIPPGLNDGDHIRYPGLAPDGSDLVVTYRITPDPRWQVQGKNVLTELSIDFWDLIVGSSATIDTLEKTRSIEISIPPRTQPGTVLRVRGQGLPTADGRQRGDLMVRILARMPQDIPWDLEQRIKQIKEQK